MLSKEPFVPRLGGRQAGDDRQSGGHTLDVQAAM